MKKFTKLFSIFTLVIMLALTLCLAVGCVEDEADETNWDKSYYIVYVYYPDGKPVEGVFVQLCDVNNVGCELPVKTDAKGRAEIKINIVQGAPVMHLMSGIPTGYEYTQELTLTKKVTKVTLSAKAN